MRPLPITSALILGTLALTACGQQEPQAAPQAGGDHTTASGGAASGGDGQERITPGGIAAVVREHLGPETVRGFVTYGPEPGTVLVMVRLRDATPHNFAVQVFSPEAAEMYGEAGTCPPGRASQRGLRCRTLDDGTTVTTIEDAHGFSDDNADGMVLSVSTITPDDGGALVMYESYDDSPAVTAAGLEDLLTDPRLTWRTDPAVNEAGTDVRVRHAG